MRPRSKSTALELFAAFSAQIPLLTRADLESAIDDLRASPGWARALIHARRQALAIGLREADMETAALPDVADEDATAFDRDSPGDATAPAWQGS